MKIVLTEHARLQMKERDVLEAHVRNTVMLPMQIVKSQSGRFVAQRVYNRNGRPMLLRVFYEKHNGNCTVITAYWTSKINKYLSRREL